MNNSPFELFRRNLKPLMVFLTGLALFAFVVLPVLDTYMRQSAGTGSESIVARFGKTELTRSRVDYFTRNHQSTVRFLTELAQLTIARGGTPRVAGFQYDTQTSQVRSVGINQQPSTDGTIRTFMLAAEAQKAGFALDDNTLRVWLEQYTDGMISNSDIDALLMKSTQNQMGRPHLYEQLRNHLLANVFLSRGYAGLYLGDGPMSGPLMTPEENWTNFLKLNRNAVVSTYGVLVQDYLDKTNPSPSAAVIEAIYEEGKDRDPSDQSAEPAFHRRYTAKYEYLVGTYQTFLDAEVAKLSEEDIRAEYDKRLKGGQFQLPETSTPETPDADKPDADKPAEPAEKETPAGEDAKDDSKPADSKPAETSNDEPAAKEPADKPSSEPKDETPEEQPKAESESGDAEDASNEPASKEQPEADQSQVISTPRTLVQDRKSNSAVRLVGLQQDADSQDAQEKQEAADKKDEPSPDTAENKDEAPTKDSSEKDSSETPDDKPADEPASDKSDTASPADEPKDEPTDEPKDEPQKDDAPKVESFQDVRQQIAEEMAGPAASARLQSVLANAASQMQLYGNNLAIHESYVSIGEDSQPPVKPDLKKFADENGLQYEIIGPYSEVTIRDEPIANSNVMGTQFGGPGPSFTVLMYGFDNGQTQLPRQPLFAPIQTADGPAGKQYVSWKIAETEAKTPTLSEVREEVVMAVRMEEARGLAREAAEAIAKQASQAADQPLEKFVPEDKQSNIKEGLGPFTWMDSFGFAGASIGNVPELDSVGDEFMKAVFTTEVGKYAVAANQPGRVIYVIKPTDFQPSLDQLRVQFKQPTNRMMAMLLGNDTGLILRDFYEAIDQQAGYVNFIETEPQ